MSSLCRSSLQQAVTSSSSSSFAQHFLLLQTLSGRVTVFCSFLHFFFSTAANNTTTSSLSDTFLHFYIQSLSWLVFYLLLLCWELEEEIKKKARLKEEEENRETWRRKRAFILRSNHGSSWYAGKLLKGGCWVSFCRRYQQTKPVYPKWRRHCATTGHFPQILNCLLLYI